MRLDRSDRSDTIATIAARIQERFSGDRSDRVDRIATIDTIATRVQSECSITDETLDRLDAPNELKYCQPRASLT